MQQPVQFGETEERLDEDSTAVQTPAYVAPSPTPLELRDRIVKVCRENTTNVDGIVQIRKQLQPWVDQLEGFFAMNRPKDEITLTQRSWKNLWYDDPDIRDRGPLKLNRRRIWQVVNQGYYYNVSDSTLGGCCSFQNYLKGNYYISDKPNDDNRRQKRLNVINLEFVFNGLRVGGLPDGADVNQLVKSVEKKQYCCGTGAIKIPGPYGVKGRLWNAYIDDQIRISVGFNTQEPSVLDLYVLERGNAVLSS